MVIILLLIWVEEGNCDGVLHSHLMIRFINNLDELNDYEIHVMKQRVPYSTLPLDL